MFELDDTQKNYVILGLLIVTLVLIGGTFYFYQNQSCSTSDQLAPKDAKTKAVQFINNNLIREGQSASVESVTSTDSLYKLALKVQDQTFESYMTKDGSLFFTQGYDMTQGQESQEDGQSQEIPKKEKPDLKLFVMSYCPYGLQATKVYLPVYELMKDKADLGIYFVDYAMHDKKELDENLRQYCIQKNQTDKFAAYLNCFVENSDSDQCLNQAGVDQDSLNSCVSTTDEKYEITKKYNDKSTWMNGKFPKFPIHVDLNEEYGVQGSPTLVINDQKVNLSTRSPEKMKELLCQGFKEKPQECSQTLSTSIPSTGFGGGTSNNSGGSCE